MSCVCGAACARALETTRVIGAFEYFFCNQNYNISWSTSLVFVIFTFYQPCNSPVLRYHSFLFIVSNLLPVSSSLSSPVFTLSSTNTCGRILRGVGRCLSQGTASCTCTLDSIHQTPHHRSHRHRTQMTEYTCEPRHRLGNDASGRGGGGCCGEGRVLKAFVVYVRMGVFWTVTSGFF